MEGPGIVPEISEITQQTKPQNQNDDDETKPLIHHQTIPAYYGDGDSRTLLSIDDVAELLGCGLFQYLVNFVSALCLVDVGIIIQSIAFVVVAACDLGIDSSNKVWASIALLTGTAIGSFVWGRLADSYGRRKILLVTLSLNFICMFTSAFSVNYTMLVIMTLFNGFAFGGLIPVIFPYVTEFFPRRYRGMASTITSSSALFGYLYTSIMALIILPHEFALPLGSIRFTSWRAFLLVCTIPVLLTIVLLSLLPSSPRYLLNKREFEKTVNIMRKIHNINQRCKKTPQPFTIKASDFDISKEHGTENGGIKNGQVLTAKDDMGPFARICLPRWRVRLVAVSTIMFTFLFAKFTLWFWLPEFFSHYTDGRTCIASHQYSNFSRSWNVSAACSEAARHEVIYRNTLYTTLAGVPLSILAIYLTDYIGRKWLFCSLIFLSGVSVFFIWFVNSSTGALIFACCYTSLLLSSWNPLDIWVSELFPTHLRSTAHGIVYLIGRIGSIVGTVIFTEFVNVNCAVPILAVVAACVASAILSLFLPDTSDADIN